jgi:LPXTG-motif cell wall-anchored protein
VLHAGEDEMGAQRIVAVLLIVAGTLALAYGGFSYTKETHQVDVGPLHMEVAEKQQVNVPVWAGVGAIVVGGLLLVVRRRR